MPRLQTLQPHLAIPIGDPVGIGPEVVLKALSDSELLQRAKITVVGSRSLLEQTYHSLHSNSELVHPDRLTLLEIADPVLEAELQIGQESRASGELSFRYLQSAIAQAVAGSVQGIVTAPIAKSAWKLAGHHYPGQTELLAEQSQSDRVGMLFVARSPQTNWTLITLLATTHIPLRQVPDVLIPELMTQKLDLLVECLRRDFGIAQPRIAIAGLNPHSGEQGQLGHEELEWLIPWMSNMSDRLPDIQLEGPIPPDTMWVKPGQAWFGTRQVQPADAYLALYHDQGLIPVKLMAFDRAVNTSIGLPFIRTSPDHGTAFDIAGKGIAEATSMKAAIELAIDLCQRRIDLDKHSGHD